MRKIHDSVRKIADLILKKILIPISLTLVYFFVFGPTKVLAYIFARKILKTKSLNDESFWSEAVGYEPNLEKSVRQS